MTYERFEELPVWNDAIEVGRLVFVMTADRAFAGQGDIGNQLQRAAVDLEQHCRRV